MYIDQENTIEKMLKDYNMWDCRPVSLPANQNARLSPPRSLRVRRRRKRVKKSYKKKNPLNKKRKK